MNDEAESSRAALRRDGSSPDHIANIADTDPEEVARERLKDAKERRLDAKRKRIRMLGDLLRELDLVVYMELLALYHLEYDLPARLHIALGLICAQLLILLVRSARARAWQLAYASLGPNDATPT